MNPYICVTYAHENSRSADFFGRGLARYGFRYDCVDERTSPTDRGEVLSGASLLIALTSPAAARAEMVASDIRHALERGIRVLCVSLLENELDHRFCTGTEGGAVLIPFPTDDTPDRHTLALFVHRLFVRHLTRLDGCFLEENCDGNVYGQLIRCAYYAHRGDYDACFELGRAYELGLGVPALEKEAAIWLNRAAKQDVRDALIRMGYLYLVGQGVDRDPDAAFDLFSRAAELGDIRGIYRQGLCYLEGHGVMKDPVYAVERLKVAAEAHHVPSLYRLALLYRDGIGTKRNSRVALKYLAIVCGEGYLNEGERAVMAPVSVYRHLIPRRYTCITMRQMRNTLLSARFGRQITERVAAAREGSQASADYGFGRNTVRSCDLPEDRWETSLTTLYTSVYGGDVKEEGPSFDIYEEDWTRADAARAAFTLGDLLAGGCLEDGLRPSPTRALVWYRYAAYLGHTEALYTLGDAYRRGYGTPANVGRAVELFHLAAEGGSQRGQFAYAVCCERGIGREINHREAFRLYELAADGGYPPAQNNLGGCYEFGIGTPKNMTAAIECYAAAANAGQADGQCRLGICYELGRGVSVDPDKAIRLYELAEEHRHAYAIYRRALCYDRGSSLHVTGQRDTSLSADRGGLEGDTDPRKTTHLRRTTDRTEGMELRDSTLHRGETSRFSMDHARAADLYKQAADLGIPEAAYAYYLCHRLERGLVRDDRDEILYLRRAAEGGCLQAVYELGLCYMDGCGLPKDPYAAVGQFARAADLWRALPRDTAAAVYMADADNLPPDAFSPRQATGGALYMLAYCILYGMDEKNPSRKRQTAELYHTPTPQQVQRAAALLQEAAGLDHVGSLVLLGDLYAYGLLTPDEGSAEDEALHCYTEALRAKTSGIDTATGTRGVALRDPTDNLSDALMSLAERAMDTASPEDPTPWRYYSECAALGSADALVAMAECLYHGLGTTSNPHAAFRLLRRAVARDGGQILAALRLGDTLWSRWGEVFNPNHAEEIYRNGLKFPCRESENGPYTLGLRRADRKRADIRARAEILYRLAVLHGIYFSEGGGHHRRESFQYLAQAILMGHGAARDDLARIYAYENQKGNSSDGGEATSDPKEDQRRKSRRRRLSPDALWGLGRRNRDRLHQYWLQDYYNALSPEPLPFSSAMRSTAVPGDLPEYVTLPVTDLMRANALQYLGECFFEGIGVPTDTAAAVTCYRAALDCAPKGLPTPPTSVVEATYSLGWCLLHGVGTATDSTEALRLLNSVSRSHPGACFTLGLCHEEGLGTVADSREAIRFYRKAQRLGHPEAAAKVAELEKQLPGRAT